MLPDKHHIVVVIDHWHCDYYDADHLKIGGPVVRHQTIVLLEAMVRQAIELVSETTPPATE